MPSKHRARIMGTRHVVAAGHYLAAQAGFQILESGGNAIDAGVAAGIALGVVQSHYVSIAGVAPIMVRPASTGKVVTITGLGHWPKATRREVLEKEYGRVPDGILSTVVPAAPDAWIMALEKWGTIGFAEAAEAAIRFARDGFPTTQLLSDVIKSRIDQYSRWESNKAIYLPGGRAPEAGELFRQEDLGRSLQYMADQDRSARAKGGREAGLKAARDAFYKGDLAQAMVRFNKENGGWLAADDLAGFSNELHPPLVSRRGDVELYSCGPWCQGTIIAQTFKILAGVNLKAMGHNSPAYVHHVIEALKLAYADRHRYVGDPNFVDVPIDALMSDAYLALRRMMIDPKKAAPGMPEAGTAEQLGIVAAARAGVGSGTRAHVRDALDTSYVCVADRHGNLFSATPSDASSSSPVVPGLGFVPSNRGTQSWVDPNHPASVAPGKRPRLTPNPAIAVRHGQWEMPFGTPGNDVQGQAMLQVLFNMTDFEMTPQDAIEAPRFATVSYPRSSEPHSYNPARMHTEGRIPLDTVEALTAMGHEVIPWPAWDWKAGAVCAVRRSLNGPVIEGASDPRRPTGVMGW